MKRTRTALLWLPIWEGPVLGWTCNFIKKNLWRCDPINEFADLLQDAYLVFLKICERYPRVVEPKHFMALYKTSLQNQMHDRASYMKRKRELHVDTTDDVSQLYADRIGEYSNWGFITASLNRAPKEVRAALGVLTSQPEQLRASHGHENLNMRFRRVLGEESHFDYTGGLREILE